MTMKADIILMNPPFNKGLHMKFLEKVGEISNNVISVQPINKFQQVKLNKKDFPFKISNIDIINDANEQFKLSFKVNIGIICIDKDNCTEDSSKVECLLYEDTYNKIKDKQLKLLKSKIEKRPSTKYSIRFSVGTGFDPEHNYNWVSKKFDIATSQRENGHIGFISMNSNEEQRNLFNYARTHFFKFCVIIGNDKLVPWMEDYTHEWTDEMLYKYFDLSKKEIEIIHNETNKYM